MAHSSFKIVPTFVVSVSDGLTVPAAWTLVGGDEVYFTIEFLYDQLTNQQSKANSLGVDFLLLVIR